MDFVVIRLAHQRHQERIDRAQRAALARTAAKREAHERAASFARRADRPRRGRWI